MENMGLVMLLYLVAIFIMASVVSFGKMLGWFFRPRHLKFLQRFYWICVLIAILTTIFEHI